MPTTSSQPRRPSRNRRRRSSRSSNRDVGDSIPLKGVSLRIVIAGHGAELKRLASQRGLDVVERSGGELSLTIADATPEEALAKLAILADLLASSRT